MSRLQCHHSAHTSCLTPSSRQVGRLIAQAEKICQQRQQRFTALRKQVLTLVCQASQPAGAYQLLDALKACGYSSAPPTVYRALDFLLAQGFVHRLASNNTYLACAHPDAAHQAVFLVCEQCGFTQEVHTEGISRAVSEQAGDYRFDVRQVAVEATGLCRTCRRGKSPPGRTE